MTTIRKPCSKCSTGRGIAECNGCKQKYCFNHFKEHRDELTILLDNVNQEHNSLRSDLFEGNLDHPLLSRIDTWEEESIMKIRQAAELARANLHHIFDRMKNELKPSVENLAEELSSSRKSDDYTETDINKWTERITALRKTLDNCSTINMEYDNHAESVLHLIKICDQEDQQHSLPTVQSSEESVRTVEEPSYFPSEKFDNISDEVILTEADLKATCPSRRFLSEVFVYGVNRYSSEMHNINFQINRKGESPIFVGIIKSTKEYDRSILASNNSSVNGWWDLGTFVANGKHQGNDREHEFITGDMLTLSLDCDNRQILLKHHRTKRLLQIPINIEKCPFPWKILIGLSNFDDCIRIIV